MAPIKSTRPGRLLLALLALVIALAVVAFWPGTDHSVHLGLDLRGGTQITLQPKPVTPGATITDDELQQTVAILRQRVDGLGVAESEVAIQGSGSGATIVVSVPGVGQDRLLQLVQRTALLDFRPVWQLGAPNPLSATAAAAAVASAQAASVRASASPTITSAKASSPSASSQISTAAASPTVSPSPKSGSALATASPIPSASPSVSVTGPPVGANRGGTSIVQSSTNSTAYQTKLAQLDCTNPIVYKGGTPDNPTMWLGTCAQDGSAKYNLEPAFIRGTNVTGASAVMNQNGIGWVVNLDFDSAGAKALADASQRLSALPDCGTSGASPCNAFAIVLDGTVVSAPRFNSAILGGSAQIEGNFNSQQANDLANVLKYGALPVTLTPVDVSSVSPTVGNDQLRAGIIAGLLGLALVMLYLLFYYRALGLVAIASLVIAGAVTYLSFIVLSKTIGLSLSLAGVAGAIVAIGITADTFIVYFERLRDELRDGRSLRAAADSGWVRARRTLLAADFVSILAAAVLYFISVGSVRGFAFVLGLTTIIDIIVAFWFTHPIVVWISRTGWMQRGSRLTGVDARRMAGTSAARELTAKSKRRSTVEESPQTGDDEGEMA